jgi:DNA invertase Pin-like site-specific DNA recombinase
MKRCIELIRVSTESQAATDKASIPAQRSVNRRTAETYGLTIVRSIEISDVSGAQVLLAPEIQEMLRLMNDVEIHGVIVREFSRLMRPENFADYALLQAFVDTETWLYLPDGPINFASNDGFLMGTMKAAMGGLERREMVKKMWQIKEQKRREGGFSQSAVCLPFGVTYPWRYTPDSERVREAFRLLLSGDTSYASIGRKVEIDPYSLRVMLRNPIYTGWRVIDKRRDPSPRAKKAKTNGRQADRPKIQRAPEDVIRFKVIDEPLISEAEFNQAQRIMDLKKTNHWRMNSNPHRFTYNGFLLCGECQGLIYTKYRRDDYYVCKVRCGAPYQRRDILDPKLDKMFTRQLTRPTFLNRIVKGMQRGPRVDNSERLKAQLESLEAKRKRILDAYFDGAITIAERDARQVAVLRERRAAAGMLERELPQPTVTLEALIEAFSPFTEFDLLNREDKRALLNTLTPSIVASNYVIKGLFMGLDVGHNVTRTDAERDANEGNYSESTRIWLPLVA